MTEAPLITTVALEVGYRQRAVLPPVSIAIRPGETWALAGPNGSGKSTFLCTLLGLLSPVRGRVERRGGAHVAYVPQRREDDHAVPSRVVDYVRGGVDRGMSFLSPLYVLRHVDRTVAAMRETETLELASRPFDDLSEGQKQRVQIARALASVPDLLVLDEPTSAMDPIAERGIFTLLDRLKSERALALLVASHQMSFIPEFATHVLFVDGDRKVVVAGDRDEILGHERFVSRYGRIQRAEAAGG